MATKYYCDVCRKEHWINRDLSVVEVTPRNEKKFPMRFDVCEECKEKMFKPVKDFRSTHLVALKEEWEDA